MKRILLLLAAVGLIGSVAVLSAARSGKPGEAAGGGAFEVEADAKVNPWTGLTPNWAPDQFQFAVVADRTGGHRKGIFSRAVQQVNLMQPEFVMSVGDLIEGSNNADTNRKQWEEFDGYARQFKMPFFYCPGNHDAQSLVKQDVWVERLGRKYYHFGYKNCLFVVLNDMDYEADDPKDPPKQARGLRVGKRQREAVAAALKKYPAVHHTFLFVHHPVWAQRDLTETGWLELEELLKGRKYTVFCGHVHSYRKYVRNGMNYYQLATTGGGSSLRGIEYGEFDQIGWVTVNKDGPTLANVLLGGVLKDDLKPFPADKAGGEPGRDALP
ncbi:MAG: metallophosphoesterase, partial [Gemmataceae bacterium]